MEEINNLTMAIALTDWSANLITLDKIDVRVISNDTICLRLFRDGKQRSFPQYMIDCKPEIIYFNEMTGICKIKAMPEARIVEVVEPPKKKFKAKKPKN